MAQALSLIQFHPVPFDLRPTSHQHPSTVQYPEVFDSPGGFGPGWRMGFLAADGRPRCAFYGRLAAEFYVHRVAHHAHHLRGEPVGHRKASREPWTLRMFLMFLYRDFFTMGDTVSNGKVNNQTFGVSQNSGTDSSLNSQFLYDFRSPLCDTPTSK
jgi:hypothetical protein